jgi:hypothetical protein
MGYRQGRGYCDYCERMVRTQRQTPNHVLHLLITVLLCGLWLPVWFLVSLVQKPRRCTRCGARV